MLFASAKAAWGGYLIQEHWELWVLLLSEENVIHLIGSAAGTEATRGTLGQRLLGWLMRDAAWWLEFALLIEWDRALNWLLWSNTVKDWESSFRSGCRLICNQEGQLVQIVVLSHLLQGSVLVAEEASLTVGAVQSVLESRANLGLVLVVVYWWSLFHKFEAAMCELAFVPVSAMANFDPILAHFGLVLSFVHSLRRVLSLLLRGLLLNFIGILSLLFEAPLFLRILLVALSWIL